MRICIQFTYFLICACLIISCEAQAQSNSKPNIILIIADDLGVEDCAPYGHPRVRTPNLTRLAKEGMRFDRAFLTCSSCSPSRSSMITGRYPHNTGAEELHWPLPKEQITFPEKLKAAGYWTAAAGKWHLGNDVKNRFDQVREVGSAGFQLPTGDAPAVKKAKASEPDPSGCAQWVPTLKDRPRDKPFFLWLAAVDPHRDYQPNAIAHPHQAEDAVVPPYLPDHLDVRKDLALYYDEIARLDHYVGLVLDELDRQKIAENTCVIFLSDNGRPFPRCKTTVYDSGVKTPLLIRWPAKIKAGSVCSSLVSSIDLAPTLTTLAGANGSTMFQGKDFSPLLSNPKLTIREQIFAEHNWHDYQARGRAVRTTRFKYILNDDAQLANTPPADAVRSPTFQIMRGLRDQKALTPEQSSCFLKPKPREELYDVDSDPHELRNLIDDPQHRQTLEELRQSLKRWSQETNDQPPANLSPDEFDRETGDPLPGRKRPRVPRK